MRPGQAWSEILSFIKGSREALQQPSGRWVGRLAGLRLTLTLPLLSWLSHPFGMFSNQLLVSPSPTRCWLCRLSLQQYLELGAKRAASFSEQGRRVVYSIYEQYEAAKKVDWR